jgi:uroporphyrinogen-III synthase
MAQLLARCGAEATVAPSMKEVPLESNSEALAFARDLVSPQRDIHVLILLTGVGTQTLFDAACTAVPRDELVAALNELTIVVRGPKPVAVLRDWGVHVDLRAPEPNTWHEVMEVLEVARVPLKGRTVVVQEYGLPTPELYHALEDRGARVRAITVYRWALPDDTGPLEEAIRRTAAGEFDMLMFTSAQQVRNVLQTAQALGIADDFRAAARRIVVASIGPTTSEALQEGGLAMSFEPSHSKMGHLVVEGCDHARTILAQRAATARGES